MAADLDFLGFHYLLGRQEEIVGTVVGLLLELNYPPVQLIEENPRIFHDCPVVGGLERQEGVELLDEDCNEHISDVWVNAGVLNFSSKWSNFYPDPYIVSSLW